MPKSNLIGGFVIRTMSKPKGVSKAACHVYARNTVGKTAYYVSISFSIL